jgi:uncharacterized protein
MMEAEHPLSRPLTEADLDRLEAVLAAPALADTAMRPDILQGFLAAIVSGPALIPVSRWLPVALGQDVMWDNPGQANEAIELIMRLNNEIAGLLLEGHGVDPILYPAGPAADAPLDHAAWCEGYIAGMALSEPPWNEFADEGEELTALLTPFFALALEGLEPDAEDPSPLDDMSEEEQAEICALARERLPDAVQDVYDYFIDRRQKLEPVRRVTPKVGRNDPCPCGSGKKHKHCCGAT